MKKIILDTNFLMIPFTLKVDIFDEIRRIIDDKYQISVLDKTIDELKNIMQNQKGKHRQAARFALGLIKRKKLKIIKTEGEGIVDEHIINIVRSGNYIIATQDKLLKSKIRKSASNLIVLRQKNHLVLV